MIADGQAVLDACILVQAPLRDTLLRLAEHPSVYLPRWSEDIINETEQTLRLRFGLTSDKTAYLLGELRRYFGDSWVIGYEPLIELMSNDPKDRHVLAAAVRCGAAVIVTYNKRHFPSSALDPWGIEAQTPSTFLKDQYELNPSVVVDRLSEQAENLGRSLPEQLRVPRLAVGPFVDAVCRDLGINLDS